MCRPQLYDAYCDLLNNADAAQFGDEFSLYIKTVVFSLRPGKELIEVHYFIGLRVSGMEDKVGAVERARHSMSLLSEHVLGVWPYAMSSE